MPLGHLEIPRRSRDPGSLGTPGIPRGSRDPLGTSSGGARGPQKRKKKERPFLFLSFFVFIIFLDMFKKIVFYKVCLDF